MGALGTALIVAGVVIYQALEPASALAGLMLDAAILPAGAAEVAALPGHVFSEPFEEPACHPLTDEVRYWVVPGGPADVAAFLTAHAPWWLPGDGTGSLAGSGGGVISYDVTDTPRSRGRGTSAALVFTVAALSGGVTGIRADAEVVPPGAECTRSGSVAGGG